MPVQAPLMNCVAALVSTVKAAPVPCSTTTNLKFGQAPVTSPPVATVPWMLTATPGAGVGAGAGVVAVVELGEAGAVGDPAEPPQATSETEVATTLSSATTRVRIIDSSLDDLLGKSDATLEPACRAGLLR